MRISWYKLLYCFIINRAPELYCVQELGKLNMRTISEYKDGAMNAMSASWWKSVADRPEDYKVVKLKLIVEEEIK